MSIHLRSRRGAIGTAWHAAAFRTAMEAFLGPRTLVAGRRIARADGVQWLHVAPGKVRGEVRGSDDALRPPTLELNVIPPDDREVALRIARSMPGLVLRIVSGTYPEDFETALAAEEISLLPRDSREVSHVCACGDWPGPCQHVSALMYALVEDIEENPAQLVVLRGLTLEEMGPEIGAGPGGAGDRDGDGAPGADGAPGDAAGADGIGADEDGADGIGADRSGVDGHGPIGPGTGDHEPEDRADDPAAPHAADFDPRIADASLLVEALGPEAARIIGDFYREARDLE